MTIMVNLVGDGLPVTVDDRTALMGGSFYYTPLRPYSPLPMAWAWEQLSRYPSATLIDVGAHTGCYTLLAKHHAGLNVWAFEPVPLTHEVLNENVRLNQLEDKVIASRLGVSDYSGLGTLHSVKAIGGSGVSMIDGAPAYHKDYEDMPVRVITLDTICAKYQIVPTLIKIDVEGGEKLVLDGARETIEKYHPFLIIETSVENAAQYGYAPSEIIALLEFWGYAWSCPEGTDLLCVPIGWEKIGKYQVIEKDKSE